MPTYAIGDLQGCCDELERLLDLLRFDSAQDQLWLVGDLINRGPESLRTLRLVMALGSAASVVLGNHDLHLLATAHAVRRPAPSDTLMPILDAPDAADILDWVRTRKLAHFSDGWLMVHAGVLPQWTVADALAQCRASGALVAEPVATGLWGRLVQPSTPLQEGDRLELYRALTVDPKLARRQRFARQGARTAGLFARRRPGGKQGY